MLTFLALFKPETWLDGSGTSTGIMGAIMNGLRTIFFLLVSIIYKLIADIYYLFEKLCNARLLSNEVLGEISKRVGLILGLIMFFYVVFSFIQMLIDPEKIENKESGAISIVKKVIIVIVLLGTSSACFEMLYGIQRKIIDLKIIPKLVIPYVIDEEYKDNFGNELSRNLLSGFYYIEQDYILEDGSPNFESNLNSSDNKAKKHNEEIIKSCNALTKLFYRQISQNNKYDLGYICLNESVNVIREGDTITEADSQKDQVHVINFNGLLAVGVGGYVLYMLAIYCFKIGVRMIQLAFLEIISPVAIISYMLPQKNNKFNEWLKIYFGTYIDVFIRILIIHFVVFLISVIFSANNNLEGNFIFWESLGEIKPGTEWLFTIVLILALLTFGKKAPDLLKELLPAGASKIGFGASMKDIVGLKAGLGMAAGAIGGAVAGVAGTFTGRPLGAISGLLKGGIGGLKGKGVKDAFSNAWKDQTKSNAEMRKVRANGGSWFGYQYSKLMHNLGQNSAADRDEEKIGELQESIDLYNTASKEAESEAIKNASNYLIQAHDGGEWTLGELEKLANDQSLDSTSQAKYQADYNKLLKASTMFNLDYGLSLEKGRVTFKEDGSLDYLRDSNGQDYTTYAAINDISDKNKLLGNANYTIEANMSKLAGAAGAGRGTSGKNIRNDNSNKITEIKLSKEYKAHKANNGK